MKKTGVCEICGARYKINPTTFRLARLYICMVCETQVKALSEVTLASYHFITERFKKKVKQEIYQEKLLEHTLDYTEELNAWKKTQK